MTLKSGIWRVMANPERELISPATAASEGTGTYRLLVKVGGDVWIGPDAVVSVDSTGYYKTWPGRTSYGGPSSHGGSAQWDNVNPKCYGSVYRPKAMGAAGNSSAGGGAVWIEAKGKLEVYGRVSADAPGPHYAPAAGSVLLVGDSIEGDGVISASTPTSGWGAGGAGRIALVQTGSARDFSRWTGTAKALGVQGASGTVYYETADKPFAGDLVICGKGSSYGFGDRPTTYNYRVFGTILTGILADGQDYTFDMVTIKDYASLGVGTNCTLRFNKLNCVGTGKNSLTLYGGTVVFPDSQELTNFSLRVFGEGSTIKFADSDKDKTLIIGSNSVFSVDALAHIEGNLVFTNGGYATHTAVVLPTYNYRVYLDVSNDLTIAADSCITGEGLGYSDTAGADAVKGYSTVGNVGGSHGGRNQNCGTAQCYGSIRKPITPGASGRTCGGSGGGVVTLKVGGELKVDGKISTEGMVYQGTIEGWYYATGAGGSIWVTAKTLSGKGKIFSDGGYPRAGGTYYAGAGGRVAVWLTGKDADFSEFPLDRITAYAGAYGGSGRRNMNKTSASAGTVYLKTGNEAENEGTLYIANRGTLFEPEVAAVQICDSVTDTDVGRVVVTNFGSLLIEPGQSLTVSREFNTVTDARFKAKLSEDSEVAHGTVNFTDATKEARIVGTNCFANLTCETPGKTLRFGTADEHTYTSVSGVFKLTGAEEGESVFAKSTQDGTKWLLDIIGSADVSYTTAWDSDARPGKSVVNVGGVIKDTENWSVVKPIKPGATNSWLGTSEKFPTTWTEATNWSQERTPVETDVVVIPAGKTAYPVLSAVTAYNSLVIEAGATLDLNACSISVTNALIVAGTLKYSGGETITFSGKSIDFTGGALSGPSGKLNLMVVGELAQEINLYNLAWNQITVDKTANSIAWQAGFTADKFKAIATADLPMSFKAGDTVTMRELELDGAGAGESKFITLASDTSASAWKLKVTQFASVIGVQVSDSDASPSSVKIYDDQPAKDNGGNSNWVFTRSRTTWVGTSGGSFTNDAMWSTGKAPDKDTMAIVTSNATIKVEGEALVGELRVLGAGNRFTGTSTLYLAETLFMNGGVLTLDVPMVVTNSAFILNGSTITHTANGEGDTYGVDLTILGDMTIDATSAILAEGKGYARGYNAYPNAEAGNSTAYGGRSRSRSTETLCYGSVMCPTNSGSSIAAYGVGGGRIRIRVGGLATVNGEISANGSYNDYISTTGGSVWLTLGSLAGKGIIAANGGMPWAGSEGGGGRVAVYLSMTSDFDAFESAGGVVSAYGSRHKNAGSLPEAPCGTVYVEGADGDKRVILDNDNGGCNNYTDFPVPMSRGGDNPRLYRDVKIVIRHRGGINLVDNFVIREVEIETANSSYPSFFLNDYELNIRSKTHKNGDGWATWTQSKGTLGIGRIKWGDPGTLLMVK